MSRTPSLLPALDVEKKKSFFQGGELTDDRVMLQRLIQACLSDAQVTALEEEAKKLKKVQTQNKATFKHS